MGRDYYIFSNGRIKRKENTIYFEDSEGNKKGLPIEDIERLHIFGEVDLNTKFLNYISRYNVLISIYNYYGFFSGSYYSKKKNVSGILLVNQVLAYDNYELRISIAKTFIDSAMHHILRNLRRYKEKTSEFVKVIENERKIMKEAKTIEEVMGAEGRARKKYYESYNTFLKKDFYFKKREKKPPNDPINALISFGNSMMYTTVLGEIYKTQLDPTISYLHEPSTKRFSLSLDLAEIFKPLIVDSVIFNMINKGIIKILKKYLTWTQNSVFEGTITEAKLHKCLTEVNKGFNKEEDSLYVYRVKNNKNIEKDIIGFEKNCDDLFL